MFEIHLECDKMADISPKQISTEPWSHQTEKKSVISLTKTIKI